MRKALMVSAMLAGVLFFMSGCCRDSINPGAVNRLKIKQLAGQPGHYDGIQVQVKGRLENTGTNYFTDMKLVLSDGQGNQIRVLPWLPISVPPPRPGGPKIRPTLQSDFLDRKVTLTGKWSKQDEGYALQVEKAEKED
jgi:hypothetical protein